MSPDPSPRTDRDPRESEARLRRETGRYLGLGLQFAVTVAVFALGGVWLDGRLGTLPLFTVLGAFIGFAGALTSLLRHVPTGRAPTHPPRS